MMDHVYEGEYTRGFHPIYILAILYVIGVYAFPFVFFAVNDQLTEAASQEEAVVQYWPLLLPAIMGLVNLITVILTSNKIHRFFFLNCTVMIKYCLIPFYIIGGLCILISLILMFSPVVIMIFVGPTIATVFSVLGWMAVVGGAPYALAYIIRSRRSGVHGRILSVIAGILQFFFTVDVISIMVLSWKEGRWRKLTVGILAVLILAILATLILLGIVIVNALR